MLPSTSNRPFRAAKEEDRAILQTARWVPAEVAQRVLAAEVLVARAEDSNLLDRHYSSDPGLE